MLLFKVLEVIRYIMSDQLDTSLNLIDMTFLGELTFEVTLLIISELLGNTVKPAIYGLIIGIKLRDTLFI